MTNGDIERYRVEAAIAAMQGILCSHHIVKDASYSEIASRAKMQADVLMKELGLDKE